MILKNITEDQAKDLASLTIIAKRDKKALKMAESEKTQLKKEIEKLQNELDEVAKYKMQEKIIDAASSYQFQEQFQRKTHFDETVGQIMKGSEDIEKENAENHVQESQGQFEFSEHKFDQLLDDLFAAHLNNREEVNDYTQIQSKNGKTNLKKNLKQYF